tara:strand:+ start:287 stop:571 length:285 start_codon:yes stop_codon:yes gene_type:complete
MKYEIKNFRDEGDNKLVGFWVTNNGKKFGIDKQVALVDGKTDEQYIEECLDLAKDEIDEFVAKDGIFKDSNKESSESSESHQTKVWNPDTKKLK